MAVYINDRGTNNIERSAGTSVMTFTALARKGDRSEADILVANGDIVLVGAIPANCIAFQAYLDITQDFTNYAATIDIGHPTYDAITGKLDGINVFDTVDLNEWKLKPILLPEAQVFSDSTDAPSILKSGSGAVEIAVRYNLGNPVEPDGKANLIFNYHYYGTKQSGGYIK